MVSHHLKLIKLARQADLESPINLDMFLDWGRRSEEPMQTWEELCRLHTERPLSDLGVEPGTYLL